MSAIHSKQKKEDNPDLRQVPPLDPLMPFYLDISAWLFLKAVLQTTNGVGKA